MFIAGDHIEIYEYEKPIFYGEIKRIGRNGKNGKKEENRKKVMSRAKNHIRRLINANIGQWGQKEKFITLTFAENIQDIKKANYEFKKFRQRLEYRLGIKLKYICVIEFQKRGAIHYHLLIFNLPYVENKKLREIWGNGFIKINNIDNVDNVGAYIVKYMTKTDDERLLNEKSYFTSRGLKKYRETINKKEITLAEQELSEFTTYENTYQNDYTGLVKYKQIKLNIIGNKYYIKNVK